MKIILKNKTIIVKIIILSVVLLSLSIQLVTLINIKSVVKIVKSEPDSELETCIQTAPMLSRDAVYYLYECGGKIGIYDAKSSILIDIVDVFTDSLPANDKVALKKGIAIYSFTDLSKIIDDFSS